MEQFCTEKTYFQNNDRQIVIGQAAVVLVGEVAQLWSVTRGGRGAEEGRA